MMMSTIDAAWARTMASLLLGAALVVATATLNRSTAQENKGAASVRIVAFGDSLTAGFELPPVAAFPAQLEKALKQRGHDVAVANAGVSGDTTSGGLQRLDWAVPEGTDAVILELGANDALRGVSPQTARANLDAILTRLAERKIAVLLAGMRSPRNWGKDYVDEFEKIYPELANKHGALLYPFFMEGVAMQAEMVLDDGLHPNPGGVAKIVELILLHVETLIGRVDTAAN